MGDGSLGNTASKLDSSSVLIGNDWRCLAHHILFFTLISLVLFVSLFCAKLVSLLQVFNQCSSVDTDSPGCLSQWPCHFHGGLCLDDFACFASRDEIDGAVLVSLLARHIWVLNHLLLRTWFGLFEFFCASFSFYRRIVHLWLLFAGSIHAKKHFSNFIVSTEVFIEISIVHTWLFIHIAVILVSSCLLLIVSLHF